MSGSLADRSHRTGRSTYKILLVLFFLSGSAALLYQVVWQRMLVFYTGSDTVSISLIVTAFMSGLGLGYLLGGRIADRSSLERNLRYFVFAELGILLFAVFSKVILYDWLYLSGPQTYDEPLVLYGLVFAVLLIPTILMGVSLPLLSRSFRLGEVSHQAHFIGRLYFVNTLGAAMGALATGVLLVRTMGYEHSLWIGILFNGLCAVGALYVGHRQRGARDQELSHAARVEVEPMNITSRLIAWSAHYALSGFAALSLELIWFRVLGSLIKSVSMTFSILLAIYLGSMALGTALGPRLAKGRTPRQQEKIFLLAQVLLYLYVGMAFVIFIAAIARADRLSFLWEYFKSYEPDLRLVIVIPTYFAIPLFLMFIPTFLMGLSFSVSQLLIQDRAEEIGRKVGWLQFINIVGCSLGAWFVTWVGFAYLGTATMLQMITALGVVYIAVLVKQKHIGVVGALGAGAVVVTVILFFPGNFNFWRQLNGIEQADRFIYDENESGLSIVKLLEQKGGLSGVVFANGLGQSSMPYFKDPIHTGLGSLPVLLHPNPVKVAVIGLGSGGTLHGAAARRGTQELVCFEIMSNQVSVLRDYADRMNDEVLVELLDDPRLRLVLNDGRYELTTMPDLYDVIQADALRPSSAFSGNIYSVEYFQLLRRRLKPGGLALTWCPTPRVLSTFCSVFPYVAYSENFLLIGSNEPFQLDWDAVRLRMADPYTRAHFDRAGIDLDSLILPFEKSLRLVDPTAKADGDINTDLFPRDEYASPYSTELIRSKLKSLLPD